MGYNLIPKNKEAGSPSGMIFSWPLILNMTGACYIFGYGENTINPGFYVYDGNRGPGSPVSNDGFKVSCTEAKMMAKIFRGYVQVKRSILKDWNKLTEEQQRFKLSLTTTSEPPGEVFLDQIESLADFCEKSKGFRIK